MNTIIQFHVPLMMFFSLFFLWWLYTETAFVFDLTLNYSCNFSVEYVCLGKCI
jgi:hypothetical protein